jgi:predicted transcriptional regulator
MSKSSEKERRKQILNNLQKKTDEEFENSLPMSRDNFKKLFNHLDLELKEKGCDDTTVLTKNFLKKIGKDNLEGILEWLANKGGYCDCEVLANVEEQFD